MCCRLQCGLHPIYTSLPRKIYNDPRLSLVYIMLNVMHIKIFYKPNWLLNHTVSHLYKLRKKCHKTKRKKEDFCFVLAIEKQQPDLSQESQIKEENTEVWKWKRNSTSTESVCDDKTALLPINANRKTWLKGLSGWNTKPEGTYSMRPQIKLKLDTRDTLQFVAST